MQLYEYSGSLYVNLTNRCPTACSFCIKKEWGMQFHGQDLEVESPEPSVRSLIEGLEEKLSTPGLYRELVFCGYGEPTMRMDALNAAGLHVRIHHRDLPIRLDTIGLGSLIQGRDIVPELAIFLDSVSVSLNTVDCFQWDEIHRPGPAYREKAFPSVLAFVAACVKAKLKTRVTAIERVDVDVNAIQFYARAAGAGFLLRPMLP